MNSEDAIIDAHNHVAHNFLPKWTSPKAGDAEFQKMGQIGAKLIWSPERNLRIHNQTTNIPLALQHGEAS